MAELCRALQGVQGFARLQRWFYTMMLTEIRTLAANEACAHKGPTPERAFEIES
jgi:hypothetical protein